MQIGAQAGDARRPVVAQTRYPLRAGVAVLAWILGVLPAVLGLQPCPFARLFHRPCPGCGMTRAVKLLLASDWRGSMHMHPLAVPMLVAGGAFALSTVWITYARGAPLVHEDRWGRASLTALAVVYLCVLALWVLRWAGYLGGPVLV